jgi:hypothetical protein
MSLSMMEHDVVSGFSLLKDDNDPPRFYIQRRNRKELIAIGDEVLARTRFAAWKERQLAAGTQSSRWGLVNTSAALVADTSPDLGNAAGMAA